MKGYRTFMFNITLGILVFLQTMTGDTLDIDSVMSAMTSIEGGMVTLWTVGNVVLRSVTNTKMFTKE